MAKYTGPTQSYQMSELLANNFTMVRVWTVMQHTFLVERKLQGADLAQIMAEYAQR